MYPSLSRSLFTVSVLSSLVLLVLRLSCAIVAPRSCVMGFTEERSIV